MPRHHDSIHRDQKRPSRRPACLPLLFAALMIAPAAETAAQVCPGTEVATGLKIPLGMAQSSLGNVIVSESGTAILHSGRISILSPDGGRRTLIDGLPSGPNDIGEPSGPAGIAMRGRTAYVLIGTGDSRLGKSAVAIRRRSPLGSKPGVGG